MSSAHIFLGTDCGATTAKTGGILADGSLVSRDLRQNATRAELGTEAVVAGWIEGAQGFLVDHGFTWSDVGGVGLAIPGPYRGHGILGRTANLPASFDGWNFLADYAAALEGAAGHPIPLVTGNDGHFAGVAEASLLHREAKGSVLLVAPGSGLGCAFVRSDGSLFEGDHESAAFLCHAPTPYHLLGLPLFRCGCGRNWGCVEAYTTISGLPQYLDHFLPQYPDHPLAATDQPMKARALALRGLAQENDSLALEIFDCQARALGHAVAGATLLLDPSHIVIGGGLIDPDATSPDFRRRYLDKLRAAAAPYLWVEPDKLSIHAARLGELSQAIGAALVARASAAHQAPN